MDGKLDSKIDELYCYDEEEECSNFGALYEELQIEEFCEGGGYHQKNDLDNTYYSYSCSWHRSSGSGGNENIIIIVGGHK